MIKKSSLVLGVMALFLLLPTAVQAQQFLTMPSCAFRPNDEDVTYTYWWDYSYADSDSPSATFYAPVYLPQDATIISVTLSFYDNSASDIYFDVTRTNLYTNSYQTLFSGSSSGTPSYDTIVDSSLNAGSRVVKNNSFHYIARISVPAGVGSDLMFFTLKIKYQ